MLTLTPVSSEIFDSFAQAHPLGTFYQNGAMALFRKELGWDTHTLFIKDGETIIGAFILAGKRGRYEIAAGPLFDLNDTARAQAVLTLIENYVKSIGGSEIDIYPNIVYQLRSSNGDSISEPDSTILELFKKMGWKHKGFTTQFDYTMNRWVFAKDLSNIRTEDELLASYRQTTRQTVKKLHKEDYSIKKLGYDELAVIKKLIDSSNDRNDVHNRPLEYYQKLYKAYGNDVEFLVVYHKETTPISAGIFVSHPNELAYFHSGADSQYRDLYGGHFLQHYVMKRAVEQGVKRYNFYGIEGRFTKNPLLVYKAGFRGAIEEYVGGFTKVVRPARYYARKAIRAPKALLRRITS